MSVLRARPVIYIEEYDYLFETVVGTEMPWDVCEQFHLTEFTSLHKQWGSVGARVPLRSRVDDGIFGILLYPHGTCSLE